MNLGSAALLCALIVVAPVANGSRAQSPASVGGDADLPVPGELVERVVEVKIEGLRRVDREAALAGIKTQAGSVFSQQQLTADLRTVWATGFFRDVRVERERVDGGWRVAFVVVEKPSIHEVLYLGNKDLSADDIKNVVDVKPYTILNVELLKRNVQKIKDLYVEKGFYLAQVSYRVAPMPDNEQQVDVFFDIVENAKVIVKELAILGNKELSDDTVKSVLQTREGGELSWLTSSGTYKEDFFQTDLLRVQALYYDHGFVTVKVGDPSVTISPDRRFIYLAIPVEEGERYKIGRITFAGDVDLKGSNVETLVDEQRLRHALSIKSGEVFNRTKLFNDINVLTDIYRDQGYAYANVTPNSSVRQDAREVDLELEVERGDLVYIGRIEIEGNTRTRDKVIRREMRIAEGDKYSASGLNASKARIFALGFFENVNIVTSRGSKPDLMDVRVEIKEKSTGTFQVGAGFSSVESFILTAQISQNNFLGNGWLLSLSAQLSFGDYARKLASLQFYDPYFLDTNWSLGFDAYSQERLYRDFQRNAVGGSPRLGYLLTPDLRLSVGYTLERIDISPLSSSGNGEVRLAGLDVDGLNSAVNMSLAYDTRDNRLFPTRGQYHVIMGEVSDPSIGSDPDLAFRRGQLFLRYYHPIVWDFVLKLNAEFGYVFGLDGKATPISERFFPGGILSVRGFEPRSLGPRIPVPNSSNPSASAGEFALGGNKQAIFNIEIEFPIIEAAGIKGVLFADAGNAFGDTQGFFYANTPDEDIPDAFLARSNRRIKPPLGLFYSVGFGFRWFSPIGPLRFEWGFPITKTDPNARNPIFEFTIGNFF